VLLPLAARALAASRASPQTETSRSRTAGSVAAARRRAPEATSEASYRLRLAQLRLPALWAEERDTRLVSRFVSKAADPARSARAASDTAVRAHERPLEPVALTGCATPLSPFGHLLDYGGDSRAALLAERWGGTRPAASGPLDTTPPSGRG
jgi:hypothetical protein